MGLTSLKRVNVISCMADKPIIDALVFRLCLKMGHVIRGIFVVKRKQAGDNSRRESKCICKPIFVTFFRIIIPYTLLKDFRSRSTALWLHSGRLVTSLCRGNHCRRLPPNRIFGTGRVDNPFARH